MTYESAIEWFEDHADIDLDTASPSQVRDSLKRLFADKGRRIDNLYSRIMSWWDTEYYSQRESAHRLTQPKIEAYAQEAKKETERYLRDLSKKDLRQRATHARVNEFLARASRPYRGATREVYAGARGRTYEKLRSSTTGRFISRR